MVKHTCVHIRNEAHHRGSSIRTVLSVVFLLGEEGMFVQVEMHRTEPLHSIRHDEYTNTRVSRLDEDQETGEQESGILII